MSRANGPVPPQQPPQRRPQNDYAQNDYAQNDLAGLPPQGWRPTLPPGRPPAGGAQPAPQPGYAPQAPAYPPQQPYAGSPYPQPPAMEPPPFQWSPGQQASAPPPYPAAQPPAQRPAARQAPQQAPLHSMYPIPEPYPDPYGEEDALPSQRPTGRTKPPPAQQAYAQPAPRPQTQPPQRAARPPQAPPSQPSGGYDLGSYAAPPNPRFTPQQQAEAAAGWEREPQLYATQPNPHQQQPAPQFAPQGYAGQPQHQAYAEDYGLGSPLEAPRTAGHHPQDFGYAASGAHDPHADTDFAAGEQEYEDDDGEYETEPRPRRRWLIAAALIASIGVGGGLAYAYKTVFVAKVGNPTQILKAQKEPARTVPENPGGRKLANADSKFMNRLEGDSGGDTDPNGVRRVQTVVVGGDRTAAVAPSQPARPVGVPGMTIVGGDTGLPAPGAGVGGGTAAPQIMLQAPAGARVITPQPPPAGGGVASARPAPPQTQYAAAAAAAAAAPAPAQPASPAAKRVKLPVPKTTQPAVAKPGAKFVAVLGSQKSKVDAMKQLADLQQKYDVLRDVKLDIAEADLSAKGLGVVYRVVAGSGTSMDQVKSLCSQLSQAGHSSKECWPLAN